MFTKQTIRDIDLKGKTVLLRADYNVPLADGKITDDYRIKQSLPTLHYLLEQDVKLIICSHLGRPEGKVVESMSLFPVAKRLQKLLEREVEFVTNCVGDEVRKAVSIMKPGRVLLLENVRFHPEEEANDTAFAKQMADLADVFVQDAFGVVHHGSVTVSELPKYLPGVAGLLLEKEVDTITKVMEAPERPLMAIIGGAKIADKLEILHRFIEIADFVVVGGAMANTFIAAQGIPIGDSLYDKADVPVARDIIHKAAVQAKQRPFVFAIPHDGVVSERIDKTHSTRIVDWGAHTFADIQAYPHRPPIKASRIRAKEKILDIGPFSASFVAGGIQLANTVVWNGTMGVTETQGLQGPIGPYAHGTETIIEALLGEFGHKPFTVVGGGDTVGYVESRKLVSSFGHVSTGGGASLELMGGHKLPGVEALMDRGEKI
jgi:phosphoglycerate kinase